MRTENPVIKRVPFGELVFRLRTTPTIWFTADAGRESRRGDFLYPAVAKGFATRRLKAGSLFPPPSNEGRTPRFAIWARNFPDSQTLLLKPSVRNTLERPCPGSCAWQFWVATCVCLVRHSSPKSRRRVSRRQRGPGMRRHSAGRDRRLSVRR